MKKNIYKEIKLPRSKKQKTTLIIFEGPDMCGKSSHVNTVAELLKKEGRKVTTFKYPDYKGKYGDEILNFLKTFDISENSIEKNISMVLNKEYMDFCNKIFSKDKLISLSKKNDYIILDRFFMSQLVYTLAWVCILSSHKYNPSLKFRWSINKYERDINYILELACKHYNDILEYFKDNFEIKTILFKKSKFISYKALSSRDSKDISKYDITESYQICVSRLFDYISTHSIESDKCNNAEINFIPSDSSNLVLDNLVNILLNVKNTSNVISTINTDVLFKFEITKYNEKNKDCKLVLTDFESEDNFIEKILDNNDIVDNVYNCIDEHISTYINNYTNDKE